MSHNKIQRDSTEPQGTVRKILYIDDINIGLKAVEEAARYVDGRKVITE